MPLTAGQTEYVPLAGTDDGEAGGPSSSSRRGADEHKPAGRGDLESGGSDGALEGGEGDSALVEQLQETVQKLTQDRDGGEMMRDGAEIKAAIATATEPAAQAAARLKAAAVALGMAGAGDLLEQGYIAISYVQSFSLFTVPDFIDWPEEWLGWLEWLHPFLFGLDLGVVLPNVGPGALFAARLAPPVLVLGWGLFVAILELGDDGRRKRWLEHNNDDGWPKTRRRLLLLGLGPPAAVLALAGGVLYLSGGLWAPPQSADGSGLWDASGSSGDDGSGSEGGDGSELTFSAAATSVAIWVAAWSMCAAVVLLRRVVLRGLRASIAARGDHTDLDESFFRMWAYGEGSVLLFLYISCYIGPVTACLKAIAAHNGDEFVPAVLWGTLCSCAALGVWLYFDEILGELSVVGADRISVLWGTPIYFRLLRFLKGSAAIAVGAVVLCTVISNSGLFVAAWLFLPFYVLVPLVILSWFSYQLMEDNSLNGNLTSEEFTSEEFTQKVTEAKDRYRNRDVDSAMVAAGCSLVARYVPWFWWTKPAMLLEKALVAVVVLALRGQARLWLSLGLAVVSFRWVRATRPYVGNAENRTDISARFSNLVMVGVGAAMQMKWITKETGKYTLAANSLAAAIVFTIR